MAFNCGMPGAKDNGFEADDFSVHLTGLSKSDLENLLNNTEELKAVAKNSQQVKKSIADKEALMQKNRELAEANLGLEPQFLVKKQELASVYGKLAEAKERYAEIKSRIDALGMNYSPSTILALMQAANAEAEDRSDEVANKFVGGEMSVDQFLREFLPLRKLCNERRFKSEKLAQSLSGSRPVVPSRPTLHPSSVREISHPSSASNPGSGKLYPDLWRQTNNSLSYGFNT